MRLLLLLLLSSTAFADPRDFTRETRTLYATAACGTATETRHCRDVAHITTEWRKHWRDKAAPWFSELLGKTTPAAVVYPFGGGDLSTLLAVYPSATEYTTLSLEGMGDPRTIETLGKRDVDKSLDKLRKALASNLGHAWNTTRKLSRHSTTTGSKLPNILTLALVALAANGYEPLEVRFFQLAPDGAPRYVTAEEVAAWDTAHADQHKKPYAVQQGLFNNVEIVFRAIGDARAPKKTFRHIAGDLSDDATDPAPLAHLAAKHDFGAMTKAASYLLWDRQFGKLRTVLLSNMTLMISDDTGIPPRYAKPAGFKQDVWGSYEGPFFKWANPRILPEMIELWKSSSKGRLAFRFGYYDSKHKPHLMFTHK